MSTATFGQATHFLALVGQKKPTLEGLKALYESGLLADLLEADVTRVDREAFRRLLCLNPLEFRITVDYGMSFQQMVGVGKYDWVNDNITVERFPIVGTGAVEYEAKLFHFDRHISSEAVDEEIKTADGKNPWESAKMECLLAFGATFPDVQRKFPIVGLGSSCEARGGRDVPGLWEDGSGRCLSLYWWDDAWYDHCRFLAVRKVSGS